LGEAGTYIGMLYFAGVSTGTSVIFTGLVYLLSAPAAESTAQPMPPPRIEMHPKIQTSDIRFLNM
jgi:hypothetical protein